jgi:uridine kinase
MLIVGIAGGTGSGKTTVVRMHIIRITAIFHWKKDRKSISIIPIQLSFSYLLISLIC